MVNKVLRESSLKVGDKEYVFSARHSQMVELEPRLGGNIMSFLSRLGDGELPSASDISAIIQVLSGASEDEVDDIMEEHGINGVMNAVSLPLQMWAEGAATKPGKAKPRK